MGESDNLNNQDPVKPKAKRSVRKVSDSGKVIRKIKGLPRTNAPVVLPDNFTFLKQPRQVTYMKYDFNMLQLRIFLSIIESLQDPIEESIKKRVAPEQLSLFQENIKDPQHLYLKIPIKDFGFSPDRYGELKDALRKMVGIPVELDCKNPVTGEDSLLIKGMFEAIIPKDRYNRYITIRIEQQVAKYLVDVNGGFTKFIKEIAINAKNKYTIRIYMLISAWKDRGGVRMDYKKFRDWLHLGDKYKSFKDLNKRVLLPCYAELHESADCWFELQVEYAKTSDKDPSFMNFKIIKAAVTIQEQEKLQAHKKNIEGMLFRRFQMPQKQIGEILNLLTLDNLLFINDKLGELSGYLADHKEEIKNPSEYVYASLINVVNSNCSYSETDD